MCATNWQPLIHNCQMLPVPVSDHGFRLLTLNYISVRRCLWVESTTVLIYSLSYLQYSWAAAGVKKKPKEFHFAPWIFCMS